MSNIVTIHRILYNPVMLVKVITYAEFLRRGAGHFVRELGYPDYSLIVKKKVVDESFAILRTDTLADLMAAAGKKEDKIAIDDVMEDAKKETSEIYSANASKPRPNRRKSIDS